MQCTFNGYDLKQVFGVTVTSGYKDFLAFPKRKDSLSENWPDEQGLDIDLQNPTFEAREFKLSCTLVANGRDDFNMKYNALFTELSKDGSHSLYITDLDRTVILYYKDQQNISKLTNIDANRVVITFDLIFAETNPQDNIPAVYLVDDLDRYLIST